MDAAGMKIRDMRKYLDGKDFSSVELTEEFLKRIEENDAESDCFITVTKEKALSDAELADKKIKEGGGYGALCGIPLAVSDNICTKGILTTCNSKSLENFSPPYQSAAMEKLESQNAVLLGKASLDEFGMGFGSTGSARSVAASLSAGAVCSDTGGGARRPAAYFKTTALRPTYGRVSRFGLTAFASSMDQVSPIAKDARDCAIILNSLAGHDKRDMTSSKNEVPDFTAKIGRDIKGMKIGLVTEFLDAIKDSEVKNSVLNAAKTFEALGADVSECSLKSFRYSVAAYYIISSAEASSNLAKFDGIKFGYRSPDGADYNELIANTRSEGFGWEVKRRVLLGNFVLSSGQYEEYFEKACAVRQALRREYDEIFGRFDILLSPTSLAAAYDFGGAGSPAEAYQSDIFTVSSSLAGLPSISVPDGTGAGISLTGAKWEEAALVQAADALENSK